MLNIKNLNVSIWKQQILKDISFNVAKNEILTILWSSWSWKSTILKALSWFIEHKWNIILNEQDISNLNISERGIILSLQEFLLYPHLNVYENINVANKWKFSTDELLTIFKISHLSKKFPNEISWWEQQRVSIARAISANPQVLLLDEPFSNLDVLIKEQLRYDLKEIFNILNIPIIIVSHDKSDAFFFSKKVLIIDNWIIIDNGDIYDIFYNSNNEISIKLLWEYNILNNEYKKYFNIQKDYLRLNELIIDINWHNFEIINKYFNWLYYIYELSSLFGSIKVIDMNNYNIWLKCCIIQKKEGYV